MSATFTSATPCLGPHLASTGTSAARTATRPWPTNVAGPALVEDVRMAIADSAADSAMGSAACSRTPAPRPVSLRHQGVLTTGGDWDGGCFGTARPRFV